MAETVAEAEIEWFKNKHTAHTILYDLLVFWNMCCEWLFTCTISNFSSESLTLIK